VRIPGEFGQRFQFNSDTDSDSFRTAIPERTTIHRKRIVAPRTPPGVRDPSAANLKLETSNFAVRSEHGYSVNIYDGIAANRPKSMRRQLCRKYDQKKIRNNYRCLAAGVTHSCRSNTVKKRQSSVCQ
jgi:hypothetical protein